METSLPDLDRCMRSQPFQLTVEFLSQRSRQAYTLTFLDLEFLFDKVLEDLVNVDAFTSSHPAPVFLVYAHDGPAADSANAQDARNIITWLKKLRIPIISDMSPVLSMTSPQNDTTCARHIACVRNILSSQFRLLPDLANVDSDDSSTVENVLLCGSRVLKEYCQNEFILTYTDKLKRKFSEAEQQHWTERRLQAEMRAIVELEFRDPAFHHVLTELAFLDIRRSCRGEDEDDGIIPVSLDGAPFHYVTFVDNCDIYSRSWWTSRLGGLHDVCFKVLRQLNTGWHEILDIYQPCYDTARQRFVTPGETSIRNIVHQELTRAKDRHNRESAALMRHFNRKSGEQQGAC